MEKFAASALLVFLIVLAFGKYFWNIFLWFCVPEKKIIMGKIIGFEEKPRIFYPPIQQPDPDLIWNNYLYSEIIPMQKDHFLKIMNHGKRYRIKISDKLFEIIYGRGIDNISLPCEKLSWKKTYDSILAE